MFDDEEDNSDRSQQYLANQRTFLSWVRTSIALIGLGFAIERFSIFLQQFRLIADPNAAGTSATRHEYSALGNRYDNCGHCFDYLCLKKLLGEQQDYSIRQIYAEKYLVYSASATIIGLGIIMIIFLIAQRL